MSVTRDQLKELTKEIPYKLRKGKGGSGDLAYIDARQVMDLLDDTLGPENWECDYKEIKGRVYCGIAINIDGRLVWKWDCGVESNFEGEKGEASDSFKRAAVRWGVGRFLYHVKPSKNDNSEHKRPSNRSVMGGMSEKQKKFILGLAKKINMPHNVLHQLCQNNFNQDFENLSGKNANEFIKQLQSNSFQNPSSDLQKEEIKKYCERLGWSGSQLQAFLKQRNMKWKTLSYDDARHVMNDLALEIDVKNGALNG